MKPQKDRGYSYDHTKLRAKERYGIELTRRDYDHLCERIRKKNQVREVSVEKNGEDVQTVFDIGYKGKKILAVFSEERNCITTFLPMLEYGRIDKGLCVYCPGDLRTSQNNASKKACRRCKTVYVQQEPGVWRIFRK